MEKVRSKLRPAEIGVIKTFSLSPNDEIGEIAVQCRGCTYYYNNLAELCDKWEDYEELKEHWTIGHDGAIFKLSEWENQKDHEEIGNYFDSREEAEKAVEKLKAWKRLKDKGFRFVKVSQGILGGEIRYKTNEESEEVVELLNSLFRGEE